METFDGSFPPGEAKSSSERTSTSDDDRKGGGRGHARQSSIRLARIAKKSPDGFGNTRLDRTRSGSVLAWAKTGTYIAGEHMKKHGIAKNHAPRALRS